MSIGFAPGTELKELFAGGDSLEVGSDGRVVVTLEGFGVRVYASDL